MRTILGGLGRRIPRPTPAMGVALLALLIACSGAAVAAIPSSDGTITACRDNRNGTLRAIDTAGQTCSSRETQLAWKDGITGKVADSDKLDNKDSTDFYAAGSKVADAAHADQADSATSIEDGSGSNLDADTLDGQDSAVFGIRTSQAGSTAYTCDLANTWNQCGIVTVVVPPGKTYTVSVWSSFSAKAPAGTSREVSYCSGGVGPGIQTSPSPCLTPIFKVRVNDYFTAASSSGERTIGEGRYGFYTAINPSDRFEVAAGSEVITKVMVRDALSPLPQLP